MYASSPAVTASGGGDAFLQASCVTVSKNPQLFDLTPSTSRLDIESQGSILLWASSGQSD